jgi:excinuclease UvrABC ATPase subunit
MTDLHDHLKLLFAKVGLLHCRQCHKEETYAEGLCYPRWRYCKP